MNSLLFFDKIVLLTKLYSYASQTVSVTNETRNDGVSCAKQCFARLCKFIREKNGIGAAIFFFFEGNKSENTK